MTAVELQAETANGNTRDNLNEAALAIQASARRARHLVEAIRDTYDNLHLDKPKREILARLDRVSVFADLIDEAAQSACERAEFIELECRNVPRA